MRPLFLSLAVVLATAGALCAQSPTSTAKPHLPTTLSIDGREFTEVVYQSHDAASVKFSHADGITALPIADLPTDLQSALGYDAAAAAVALEARAAESAATQQAIQARREAARARMNAHDAARLASVDQTSSQALEKALRQAQGELRAVRKAYDESLRSARAQNETTYTFSDGQQMAVRRGSIEAHPRYNTPENKARRERIEALEMFIAETEGQIRALSASR